MNAGHEQKPFFEGAPMMLQTTDQTRREFLKSSTTKVLGLSAAAHALPALNMAFAETGKVKVAHVRDERAISSRNVCDPKEARIMIARGLETITGATEESAAWNALGVTKQDVVAIKVNCNSWTFLLHTHPELVNALAESLQTVITPGNIVIYERRTSELSRCGYQANTGAQGVRCYGNDDGGGYDSDEELTKTVTDRCTKIINFPTLKCVEGEFGGSLFLKNHIGSLMDSDMPNCHGNAVFCTEVCARPSIKNKTVLGICDGLRGTYKRGTPWYWSGIIMSRDQIAAEWVALTVINEKRRQETLGEIALPGYVKMAETRYGLGTCNPEKIDVRKMVL